ncbi:MAG: glycoside hydrolase family 92 protein [Bacteroidales bacterium]|nr:glycoside hydrolase family 92 protein [Bacteroidales bacterium]
MYDRPALSEHLAGGTLHFSDGSRISVTAIPNDGSPKELRFPEKKVNWIKFEAGDAAGLNIGLSEIEVFETKDDANGTTYVEWADPYIETTCGRWFYCTPGGLPMGMVAAHAFTRNKNQGGGGYNYNFNEILGFTQINDWMIAGPNIMPVTGEVNPMLGIEGWKSEFKHESETIQPGYHKLFLDRYRTWVEYTATDRVAFYRFDYTSSKEGKVLVDVGSKLGSCSLNEGYVARLSPTCVVGKVSTTDRFWGGNDVIDLFFAVETDQPFSSLEGWNEYGGNQSMVNEIGGNDAGLVLNFDLRESSKVLFKMAMSYTSIENAIDNLQKELPGFDFDSTRAATQAVWNEMFGRMDVKGCSRDQKTKFYTDLWHVLLGRHKISDANGAYPDYTGEPYIEKRSHNPLKVAQLPLDAEGRPRYNMYGFDALWLTQWNLNILWGLAWPELMDDFTAGLVQYAKNGRLLPRGACAGGYSFIMTGCPATNMLVSAYMQGIMTKADPEEAYAMIRQNHLPGGMMSYESADDLKFYIKNGYCPESAGKTMEWAFQDWGLSRMAAKMGKTADAKAFEKRSHAWTPLFNKDQGLIFPKDKAGRWTNLDPLDGWGWVEANAWQATWSLSHDLDRLSQLMGGDDVFTEKLNYAFEMASEADFIASYSNGYVSYANQPGCSNAHLFSHAGKPWLTQYWVRRVQKQAYSGVTPDKGYGGHDEDQGQMGGVSALMSIGLFGVQGLESDVPVYDITSPVFDEVTITLNPAYCSGKTFTIRTYGASEENCYIQKAALNGQPYEYSQFTREIFKAGGELELWLGNQPNKEWGKLLDK